MADTRTRPGRPGRTTPGASARPIPAALQKTAARYHEFFENANDVLALFTLEGVLVLVNRGAERLLGWSRQELIGQHFRKVVTPASAALAADRTRRFLAGEKVSSIFEFELVCKDGRVIPVEARTQVIRDRKGKPLGFQGIYRDITERKRAEVALRESEERYRGLVELCPDAIVVHADEKFVYVNPAALELLGAAQPEALIGQSIWPFVPPAYRAVVTERLGQIATAGQSGPLMEQKLFRVDGQEIDVEISGTGVRYNGKQAVQVVMRDITARRHMEDAVRESEAKYRTIFQASPDFIYVTDPAGKLLDANPAILERAGLSLDQLQHMHFMDFFAGENREELQQAFAELVRHKRAMIGLEVRAKTMRGDVFDYEVNAIPLVDGNQVTRVLSVARDITARKQAEQALRETRHLRERIADTIPDILYLYDLSTHRLGYVNRQLSAILGYAGEEFRTTHDLFSSAFMHPEDAAQLQDRQARITQAADGEVIESEVRVRHINGGWRTLRCRETVFTRTPDNLPQEMLGVAQDITDHRKLEALLQERVMDSAGMPARLREFRKNLGLSQTKFAELFGYSQGRISKFESGAEDVSAGLILAIREKGYPIEALMGRGKSDILDKAVAYLPASRHGKLLARRLMTAALELVEQDYHDVETIMAGLGLPQYDLTPDQHRLLTQLLTPPSEDE